MTLVEVVIALAITESDVGGNRRGIYLLHDGCRKGRTG